MAESSMTGTSPLASAFGAKVNLAVPGRGMYLIIGRDVSPEALLRGMSGEVVLRLSDLKILATLPFTSYLALKGNYNIAAIGPVSVDVKRLSQLADSLRKARTKPR